MDTLKELFEGSKGLFEGLAISGGWNWSIRYPVVRLSFGGGYFKEAGDLRADVADRLRELEEDAGIEDRPGTGPGRLRHLIRRLHERTGQRVVVLIDEYDKPILDALDVPEIARAKPRLPAGPVRCDQGLRRAHPF